MRAAVHGRVQRLGRRVDLLNARPAFSGVPARVALRARHRAELTHALAGAIRQRIAGRARRLQTLQRQLDTLDLGRRLASVRTKLVSGDARLASAIASRRHHADRQLRGAAARLDSLSPLAVLGRGYAVCWNADRSAVIRDAAATERGDQVRVTLSKGELECRITDTKP